MKKSLPDFKTDEEAAAFVEQNDLSDYMDPARIVRARIDFSTPRFEELPKTKSVHLRVSESLLEEVKKKAADQGVNYQKYIRRALEASLHASP